MVGSAAAIVSASVSRAAGQGRATERVSPLGRDGVMCPCAVCVCGEAFRRDGGGSGRVARTAGVAALPALVLAGIPIGGRVALHRGVLVMAAIVSAPTAVRAVADVADMVGGARDVVEPDWRVVVSLRGREARMEDAAGEGWRGQARAGAGEAPERRGRVAGELRESCGEEDRGRRREGEGCCKEGARVLVWTSGCRNGNRRPTRPRVPASARRPPDQSCCRRSCYASCRPSDPAAGTRPAHRWSPTCRGRLCPTCRRCRRRGRPRRAPPKAATTPLASACP